MIARADGEPPHVFRGSHLASASGVKVTVEKVELIKDGQFRV
jgi:hypothetical protein